MLNPIQPKGPNILLNNLPGRKLPPIEAPVGGYEVIPPPITDQDFPRVMFVQIDKDINGRGLWALKRDLDHVSNRPFSSPRKVVIEFSDDVELSDGLIKILQKTNSKLTEPLPNPYRSNPPTLSGKLAIYCPSEEKTECLRQNNLRAFSDIDKAAAYVTSEETPTVKMVAA